ncbi:MAG: hypothetical protein HY544_01470 [Candidatus Diapherotrites archaeon]|uniref:Uncharacterized protein n=1 Tax=Candidatus Iainarchaeum sp. TaxID=3101447 RepID=A0A8T3YMR1_9ARCH|nr:hypothetical protein [Candidatus Diapherotrites archaeon]
MTLEQYRLAKELKARRLDKEPTEEQMARMTPEERATWENWQAQHKQKPAPGFANISIVEKKRPEQRP